MIRESLPAIDQAELLQQILTELRGLRGDIQMQGQPRQDPEIDAFLQGVLIYTGCLYRFDAGELLDGAAVDERLRQVLADRDANTLGRELADRENHVVLGRRLVKLGRGGGGNRWRFEPA